jgi:hypothetical protein
LKSAGRKADPQNVEQQPVPGHPERLTDDPDNLTPPGGGPLEDNALTATPDTNQARRPPRKAKRTGTAHRTDAASPHRGRPPRAPMSHRARLMLGKDKELARASAPAVHSRVQRRPGVEVMIGETSLATHCPPEHGQPGRNGA